MFGYALMLAGLARIIEICFMSTRVDDNENEHTFMSPMDVHSGEAKSKAKAAHAFRHFFPFMRVAHFCFVFCLMNG